ncbi:MAG TPA: hypothetical protein VJJ82_03475 [Candidatus Nanoarchaeia archaeon]|nr:hypothetical protein [Candidatus Nanoarchaeia archaeon]
MARVTRITVPSKCDPRLYASLYLTREAEPGRMMGVLVMSRTTGDRDVASLLAQHRWHSGGS